MHTCIRYLLERDKTEFTVENNKNYEIWRRDNTLDKRSDTRDGIIKTKHGSKHILKMCERVGIPPRIGQGNGNFIYINYHTVKVSIRSKRRRSHLQGTLIYATRRDRPSGLVVFYFRLLHIRQKERNVS